MKNLAKLSALALIVSLIAACDPPAKSPTGPDSTSTTVKIDSTVKTAVDSNKVDTVKKDTTKK